MAVTVRCGHCGQRYAVREDLLGKRIKCKACGQVMPIVADAAKTNSASAAAKPARAKRAVQPGAAAKQTPARAPGAAVGPSRTQAAAARTGQPAARQQPAAADPLGAAASAGDPLFGPSSNLLDLLDDPSLNAAGAAPAGSGVVLKSTKPAESAKPTAKKKKKKKKGSGEASLQAQAIMRMLGGVCVILLGLGVIGLAIAKFVSDDDSGLHVARGIRLSLVGISIIGGGLKLIVG